MKKTFHSHACRQYGLHGEILRSKRLSLVSQFYAFFLENLAKLYVGALQEGRCPPYAESWIRPWYLLSREF